ncbi:MAG: hypothetical protein C3F11_01335 [Methylocystaceae bacterium]|nr:MAG: hypothetical protein C3F11_01335 [Methylocystaceae bacterium]
MYSTFFAIARPGRTSSAKVASSPLAHIWDVRNMPEKQSLYRSAARKDVVRCAGTFRLRPTRRSDRQSRSRSVTKH